MLNQLERQRQRELELLHLGIPLEQAMKVVMYEFPVRELQCAP